MNRTITRLNVDKESIHDLKNDSEALLDFFKTQNDGTIIYALEKLGRLENGHSKEPLLFLLNSSNDNIRTLAMKNLAKLGDYYLLPTFVKYATSDKNTEVRRESVSAVGRLRDERAISVLVGFLEDNDPKVVMQAIRGLLVFSKNSNVKNELKNLANHPNELIKEVIQKELKGFNPILDKEQSHVDFPSQLKNAVVHGDVKEILKHVPDESIHLTFTSPPYYNARDYSIYQSYEQYLNILESIFKEVHRITKNGRFFVLNTSPIIIPRISRAHASKRYPIPYDIHPLLVKMGWEFIDDIVWLKSEASVKNRNAGFLQHRKPLGYKPNAVTEMLMVYRKKSDRLLDWNMKQYPASTINKSRVLDKYETTNVWRIDPVFDKIHSAVFPLELCNRVIKYYSYIGDLVFDPFAGSGTIGRSCLDLNRCFFLTEKEPRYIDRIRQELNKSNNIFSVQDAKISFVEIEEFINSFEGKQ